MLPTFKEQFEKIGSAYMNNELNPYNQCACFVGNILNNRPLWFEILNKPYSNEEILKMEKNFLSIIRDNTVGEEYCTIYASDDRGYNKNREEIFDHPNYENALFMAMESTLEMLKQIHIEKGEKIEECRFVKRELQSV